MFKHLLRPSVLAVLAVVGLWVALPAQTTTPYGASAESPGASTSRPSNSSSAAAAAAIASPGESTISYSFREGDDADRNAHINMRLPSDARVYFGNKEIPGSGDYRRFVSPPLTPGHAYTYDIRISWKDGGRTVEKTRRIRVHAGDEFNLNLARGSRATTTVSTPAPVK